MEKGITKLNNELVDFDIQMNQEIQRYRKNAQNRLFLKSSNPLVVCRLG